MKSLDPVSSAILDGVRTVLNQHGYVITRSNDASFPLYGEQLEKVLREIARNSAQNVLCAQAEEEAA